jgi:tetratricopeptide (TPR) repeat protein
MNQAYPLPEAFSGIELLLRVDEVHLAHEGLGAIAAIAPDAARLHLFRGWVALHDANTAMAVKNFRMALGRDPLEMLAWHGLSSALPEGSARLEAAERATRLTSSEAVADLRRGRPEQARAALQLAHANHPHDQEWTLLLIECLRRLGETSAAWNLLSVELDRLPLSAPATLLAAALEDDEISIFEARRLWAPNSPPMRLPRPPDVVLPYDVAVRVAELRTSAMVQGDGEWRMARIMTPPAARRSFVPGATGSAAMAPKSTNAADRPPNPFQQPEPEVAEALETVQRVTQRLFSLSREPLANGDAVALLVTHRGSLTRRYGAATAAEIERRMGVLGRALAERGLRGDLLIVDQINPSQSGGLAPVVDATGNSGARAITMVLRAARKAIAARGQRLDAILLVGGDGVIPFHRFANPSQDSDGAVLSDNPYGCEGDNVHVPEIVVARLPDGGADRGELLLALLQRSIEFHEGWLVPSSAPAGLSLPFLRRLVAGARSRAPVTAWGATAAAWQEPSHEIYRELGQQNPLLVYPTIDGASPYRLNDWSDGRILFFNLHGLTGGPNWYGQAAAARPNDPLPVALTPADITDLEPATICVTEACFGAEVVGRSTRDSMALRFLSRGALALIGCTVTAYGAVSLPLGGADILAQQIFQFLRRGQPIGRALLLARDAMARDAQREQGYLDPDDAKTLLSFVLLGDPWASPYARPVLQAKMALPVLEPIVARREPIVAGAVAPGAADHVRQLVAKVAPQFSRAPLTVQGQGRPDRVAKGVAGTVVFSAVIQIPTVDGRRGEQFARVTVAHGTARKILLSR